MLPATTTSQGKMASKLPRLTKAQKRGLMLIYLTGQNCESRPTNEVLKRYGLIERASWPYRITLTGVTLGAKIKDEEDARRRRRDARADARDW